MADYTFGKLVTDQLVARNWSQRKLAERIGKSPTYINYVVRGANPSARDGKFQPGRDSVIKIAKALDIPIDEALLAAPSGERFTVLADAIRRDDTHGVAAIYDNGLRVLLRCNISIAEFDRVAREHLALLKSVGRKPCWYELEIYVD